MFTIKEIQKHLKVRVDGDVGKETRRAIDTVLKTVPEAKGYVDWTDDRRIFAYGQWMLRLEGIDTGKIDGLNGEQTRYAWSVHVARKKSPEEAAKVETWRDKEPEVKILHIKAQVWPRQPDCTKFFGGVGTNQATLILPFPMRIAWDPSKKVEKVSCHLKVQPHMDRIWRRTKDHYGYERLKELRLDMYGGCLNVRKMRGGSAWSMHSWGIAWDVDPERNQLKFTREKATLDDKPYEKFWEFVYDEGAISLGRECNYDWMHFQFARL